MGVFEFVILIVFISTVGKVVTEWNDASKLAKRPQLPPPEVDELRQNFEELHGRVIRLEEERDFYRNLLENPEARKRAEGSGDPS